MLRTDFLRSTSFRSGSFYAALFLISVLSIFVVTYKSVSEHMRGSLNASINEDVRSLIVEYNDKGLSALKDDVVERIAEAQGLERVYAFLDNTDALVSSNVTGLPQTAGAFEGVLQTKPDPLKKLEPTVDVIGEMRILNGGRLFVGRSTHQMKNTLMILRQSFVIGGLCTTAAALLLGMLFGRIAARRIEDISQSTRSIVHGGLKDRITLKGTGDEFDNLSVDINLMLDRIHELMEGLRHTSNNIAHDLRTPLSRIRHGLEAVLKERPADLKHYRKAIINSIAETDGVIETFQALLRISQIEDGTRRNHFKRVDLSDIMRNFFDIYEPVTEEAGLLFESDIPVDIYINGDQELLTQLFANLISNGVRYVPKGGKINLKLEDRGSQIIASVIDNGPGIPAQEREKVFQRLYRMDQSRTTPGSGLGLSLVAAIVSLHSAKIRLLDNEPGLKVEIAFTRTV